MSVTTDLSVPTADYGVFKVPAYDIRAIAAAGNGRLSIRVKGFWSSEPVCIKLRRESKGWYVTVDHSTGGCEGAGDPLDEEQNFASALIFAVNLARTLRNMLTMLDATASAA